MGHEYSTKPSKSQIPEPELPVTRAHRGSETVEAQSQRQPRRDMLLANPFSGSASDPSVQLPSTSASRMDKDFVAADPPARSVLTDIVQAGTRDGRDTRVYFWYGSTAWNHCLWTGASKGSRTPRQPSYLPAWVCFSRRRPPAGGFFDRTMCLLARRRAIRPREGQAPQTS